MSLATHGKIAETHGLKTRILMLVAPLAALIYPFTLRDFNASVTTITSAGGNGGALPWITAAISLLIAFAVCDAVRQFIQVRPVATAVGHDPRLGDVHPEKVSRSVYLG